MPTGPKVEEIKDIEEFFQQIKVSAFAADIAVKPFQVAILPGDYYIRFVPQQDIVVCGEIQDPLGYWETVPKPWDMETQAEYDYEKSLWEQSHMRNMRWTKSYSALCREGELGSVHVATMSPLTQPQFEALKLADWPHTLSGCMRVLRALE